MNIKRKVITAIIILLPILLCVGIFAVYVLGIFGDLYYNDIHCGYNISRFRGIFVEDMSYRYSNKYYIGDSPTEDEIIGTVNSYVEDEHPTENGQTNVEELLGQPYALRDGKLLVRKKKQLERPVKNEDGTWSSVYYYRWYELEPVYREDTRKLIKTEY